MMFRRPAATTTALALPGRGRALTRRMADYFGLSYPHEFTSAASLLIALILLRVITIMHYRFGSDEPQHLHVVWGWARGVAQSRIDNAGRADRGFPHRSLLRRLHEDIAPRHVDPGRGLGDSDFRWPRATGYRLGADSRRVGSVLRQRVDCSCYDHGRVCAVWHLAAVPLLGFRSQLRARFEQPSRMVGDYLCCRIPTRHARGALDRYRAARWRGGGAPEFCLCHGRLLFYRAPFLLALSFAAGLPPLLSARLCHLYGRSSDDFGPLVTESGYREDLASRALACLVWRMRIIGRLVGSSFLGKQGETGERSFASHAQTY